MSRSRRKTPIIGIAGTSDKWGKRKANRALRKAVTSTITTSMDTEDYIVPKLRERSNVWNFSKDGKTYIGKMSRTDLAKWMRK